MLFQAVRNERCGLVVGSLIPKPEDPKFESRLRKKHPRSAEEARRKTSSVTQLDFHQVRTTDGYRILSRRPLDRNQSWVFYTSVALKKRPVKLDAKRSYRNSLSMLYRSLLRQNMVTVYRCGAEAALRAHNPEVIRSKRIYNSPLCRSGSS